MAGARLPRRRAFPAVVLAVLLGLSPVDVPGQEAPPLEPPAPPAEDISVYLLTMGPGDAVWEVFGHNAIWIRDPRTGTDLAYNWGMFSFDQPGFLPRLAQGTMLYWMAGYPADDMIRSYAAANRDVWAQELRLTPRQRLDLVALLQETDTDANRFYTYDYYRDNCSTRVRDALDTVLGGRLRETTQGVPTGVTWRWQAQRLLQAIPAAYAGMHLLLGSPSDEPIDRWQEDFLPLELMKHVRGVTVPDAQGNQVPLVLQEYQVIDAGRPPAPEAPPFWLPWFLAAGLAVAALLILATMTAARGGKGAALARGCAGALAGTWSLIAGAAGLLLVAAWLFTDHVFWFWNENLLQTSPLSLALLVPCALLVVGRPVGRVGVVLALLVLAVSLLGFALQALPWVDQVNGEVIAFALPVHAAVAWTAWRLGDQPRGGAARAAR